MSTPEDRSLVPASVEDPSGQALDRYEREYMAGRGVVLYRDKHKAGRLFNWLMGGTVVATMATAAVAGAASVGPMVLTGALLATTWLLFSVLRVTVTTREVNIQLGLFGPTIPIENIESARAVDYNAMEFGGWGIKGNFKGERIYNMPGDGGRAVRIEWRDGRGRKKVTLVGTRTATELAAQIERARQAQRGALVEGHDPAALGPAESE